ncbi:MAG: N-acetylmuramoyl-L-alanine amidase [Thermoleophilia bacterium]
MYTRGKKKYLIGAAATIVVIVTAVLFLPGFSGQTPPPETIGGDIVSAGADFESGTLSGTSVAPTAIGGEMALSLQPSLPQGDYLSEPQETAYAFNALGLHWKADLPEGARIDAEIRFSQDGGQWGDWQPVNLVDDELPNHFASTKSAGETIGDLVFTDAARYFQYRLDLKNNAEGQSPAVTKLTASYIDAKGYHESPLSVATLTHKFDAAISPSQASATPNIISRAQWGADDNYTQANWPPTPDQYAPPQKIVLHHTAGGYDAADPDATVRSIFWYHASSLGWGDIGYNYLIGPGGQIYEGRMGGNGVIGAHALGWNTGSIGISVMGNYENYDINGSQYNAIVELMTWAANVNHIDPYGNDYFIHYENGNPVGGYPGNILGHRDLAGNSTACPGNYLYARMPQFRAEVNARYSPVPIRGDILARWNSLNRAPGAALAPEYAINNGSGTWIGQAQDFSNGRLTWNNSTRNVFWSKGAILAKYDALGRQAGFLGMPLSDEYDVPGGKAQNYTGGRIYWSAASGAHEMHGEILNKFLAAGGTAVIGFPTTDEQNLAGVAGARENQFTNARIYWHGSIGAFEVRGAIFAKYLALGGPASLGLPISDEMVSGPWGGRESRFQNDHRIYWSAAGGAHLISGEIRTRYLALGGPAVFGVPTTDIFNTAGVSGAQEGGFQAGRFYASASTGAHEVHGAILGKYLVSGGPQAFGLPTSDEMTVANANAAARMNTFERAHIYWSTGTGAHEVHGAILDRYKQMVNPTGAGANYSSFGLPTTDETGVPGYASGRKTELAGATIYWSGTTGAHEVHGAIRDKWLVSGGPASWFGLPTSDETNVTGVAGAKYNQFQGANIYWSSATGPHEVHGAIRARYQAASGPAGALALPTSDEYNANTSIRKNNFQHGYISWNPSAGALMDISG